jgi:hypothetical protein
MAEAERRKNYDAAMGAGPAGDAAEEYAQAATAFTSAEVRPERCGRDQGSFKARDALNPPKKETPKVDPPKTDPNQAAYNQNITAARNAFAASCTRKDPPATSRSSTSERAEATKIVNDCGALNPPKKERPRKKFRRTTSPKSIRNSS